MNLDQTEKIYGYMSLVIGGILISYVAVLLYKEITRKPSEEKPIIRVEIVKSAE